MTDIVCPDKRSDMMSRISSKHTKPELKVRKHLHALGFRFRLHVSGLPGSPDIVLPKHNTAIQVRGCFWHQHTCREGKIPKSRVEYWKPKLERNVERDRQADQQLAEMGWHLIVVWECEIRSRAGMSEKMERVVEQLRDS